MRSSIFTVCVVFFAFTGSALADSWSLEAGVTERSYTFGELSCVQREIVKPSKHRRGQMPQLEFECSRDGKSVFELPFGSQFVTSSKDHDFIVGLSNNGLDRWAFWIIDKDGNVLSQKRHSDSGKRKSPGLRYCEASVTLVRQWFDDKKRTFKVGFDIEGGVLKDVFVRSCDGNRLSLAKITPIAVP